MTVSALSLHIVRITDVNILQSRLLGDIVRLAKYRWISPLSIPHSKIGMKGGEVNWHFVTYRI